MNGETKPPTTSDVVTEQDKGRCAPALGSATDTHARARIVEREIAQMTDAEKQVLGEQVAELMRFFNMQPNK